MQAPVKELFDPQDTNPQFENCCLKQLCVSQWTDSKPLEEHSLAIHSFLTWSGDAHGRAEEKPSCVPPSVPFATVSCERLSVLEVQVPFNTSSFLLPFSKWY